MKSSCLVIGTTLLSFLFAMTSVWALEPSLRDVEYAKIDDVSLKLDLYLPGDGEGDKRRHPTVVWVHGGAWRSGSKESVPIAGWTQHGFAIASVDYRLSPQAKFPAQSHDIKGAIRFLRRHAERYRLDPHRFVIAGASAGGHLAALVGVSAGVPELEGKIGDDDDQSSAVQAIVSFYGASNLHTILQQSTEYGLGVRVPALELFLGGQPSVKPDLARLASPVAHVDASDPPLWLIHGLADPQMPPQQSDEFAEVYRKAGLRVSLETIPDAKHGGEEFYRAERLATLADQLHQQLSPPRTVKRLLFAGSSSAYWNDLPNEVAKTISQHGGLKGWPIEADIVGRSGSDIRVYLDPNCDYQYGVRPGESFLDKVRAEANDYVVLMVVSRFIMGDGEGNEDGEAHRQAITRYCEVIRESGGEPVFYEVGWGESEREAEGRLRIRDLARQNKIAIYVPCSTAWARVRQARPDLALQHPNDASHPGDLGHFLNVACFYAALVQQSPEGKLPTRFHVWPHLTKAEKEAKKTELEAAFSAFRPDPYQARLPEWMRRQAGAGYRGHISDQDARYLERVAWETWEQVRKESGLPQ